MGQLLLDFRQVAEVLGTSDSTVKRLVRAGDLPTVHLAPRVVRVRRVDLEAYVDGLRGESPCSSSGAAL